MVGGGGAGGGGMFAWVCDEQGKYPLVPGFAIMLHTAEQVRGATEGQEKVYWWKKW